jgi:hypothetical protein
MRYSSAVKYCSFRVKIAYDPHSYYWYQSENHGLINRFSDSK